MTTTQVWMLCIILAMVFFFVLTTVWEKMGKNNDNDKIEGE